MIRLVAIALKEVGVREFGTNSGVRIEEYQRATVISPGPWPWCAAFVDWCVWRRILTATPDTPFRVPKAVINSRPRTGLAYGLENWGTVTGCKILTHNDKAEVGDLVTYNFASHCGIVVEDNGPTITCVEGNTNSDGSREGDGVYLKVRDKEGIRKLIRMQ